ncbi:hypothetical protein D3C74_479870 [compost metagenome]
MVIRYWNLGRRNQIIPVLCQLEEILLKLWQLTCSIQAIAIYDIRRKHFFIAVLIAVQIHHKAD